MLIFAGAFAFALAGTPLVRKLALRVGFFDSPSARKLHTNPIPLLGGAAIYLSVVVSMLIFGRHYLGEFLGILTAASLMAALGLWDDRIHLRSGFKLALQFIIVNGLYFSGVEIRLEWLPNWLDYLLTIVWFLGITNAVNFLDNMDGLSGGVSAIAAAFFMVIAAMNGQFLVGALAAALFGASAGFLFYNRRPATIFMGDAGSLFLGLMLATLGIKLRFPGYSETVTWMVPLLVLGVPIFDTGLVSVSRIRRGVNPFTTAGKDHLSHRLVGRGYSHLEAVLYIYLLSGFFGLLGIFVMHAQAREGYPVGLVFLVMFICMLWKLEWHPTPSKRSASAEAASST